MVFDWFFKDSSDQKQENFSEEKQKFKYKLDDFWQKLFKEPKVVPLMTYEDVIKYFVSNRPSDSRVKKGVLLRMSHSQGQLLAQMFLDFNDQIIDDQNGNPYGRQLVARKLDQELLDAFDKQDLIIVE